MVTFETPVFVFVFVYAYFFVFVFVFVCVLYDICNPRLSVSVGAFYLKLLLELPSCKENGKRHICSIDLYICILLVFLIFVSVLCTCYCICIILLESVSLSEAPT